MNKIIAGIIGALALTAIVLSFGGKEGALTLKGAPDFNEVKTAFTNSKSVTVGTSAVAVLAANGSRQYALLTNDSDTAIYLNLGTASTTSGNYSVRVNANGGQFEIGTDFLYKGQIWASSTAASKVLRVVEF